MFNNFQIYLDKSLPDTPSAQDLEPLNFPDSDQDLTTQSDNNLIQDSSLHEDPADTNLIEHLKMPTTVNLSLLNGETPQESDIPFQSYSPHVVYMFESDQEQPSEKVVVCKISRKQTAQEFLDYQNEWLQLRNSKLESVRHLQAIKILKATNSTPIVHSQLPENYKGPVRGYYEHVGRYFEHKLVQRQLKEVRERPKAHPQLTHYNHTDSGYLEQVVELRLLQKGKQYKSNLAQLQHQIMVSDSSKNLYRPVLVANQEVQERNSFHSTHETLYLDGIKSLIKKQQLIVTEIQEELRPRMPQISEKSRKMACNRTFEDLYRPYPRKEEPTKIVKKMSGQQMDQFIDRNYELYLKQKVLKAQEKEKRDLLIQEEIKAKTQVILSEGSQKINERKNNNGIKKQIHIELYNQAKQSEKKKKQNQEKFNQLREEKEMQEATFTPKINSHKKAKLTVPLHSISKSSSQFSLSKVAKTNTTYRGKHQIKQDWQNGGSYHEANAFQNLSASVISNANETFSSPLILRKNQNYAEESQRIYEEALRVIEEFELSASKCLMTPPAHQILQNDSFQNETPLDKSTLQAERNEYASAPEQLRQQYQDNSFQQISPPIMHQEYFVREQSLGSQDIAQNLSIESMRMLDQEVVVTEIDDFDHLQRSVTVSMPRSQPMYQDSRVNRTLSAIQEDFELEDDMSQLLSRASQFDRRGSTTPQRMLSFTGKSDLNFAPRLVIEMDTLETDFNQFLEKLYS